MLFLGLPDLRGSWSISEHDVFVYRQNFTRDPHMSSTCRPETSLLVFWIPPPAAPGDFPHRSICMAKPPLRAIRASKALFWFCNDFAVRISMSGSELQMPGLYLTQMSG